MSCSDVAVANMIHQYTANERRQTIVRKSAYKGCRIGVGRTTHPVLRVLSRPSDTKSLQRLGRMASTIGHREDLAAGTVEDARFGAVNSWPTYVWDEAAARMDAL